MTVNELIEALKDLVDSDEENGELSVMVSSDYGDHGHTEQLDNILEVAGPTIPVESGHSNSGWAYPRHDEEEGEENVDGPENGVRRRSKVIALRSREQED